MKQVRFFTTKQDDADKMRALAAAQIPGASITTSMERIPHGFLVVLATDDTVDTEAIRIALGCELETVYLGVLTELRTLTGMATWTPTDSAKATRLLARIATM